MRKEFKLENWNDKNTPLKVAFSEKEHAKSLGAKWDMKNKVWFVEKSNPNHQMLQSQYPLFTRADINLIPETCWYSNLRSILPKSKWDIVRKKTYSDNSLTCEFCRGQFSAIEPTKQHPVEAHELWQFDDFSHTQTLTKVLCLCPDCHLTQHLGFANTQGLQVQVMSHYQKIAKISEEEAEQVAVAAFKKWKERSQHEWELNLTWLYENFPEISEQDITLDR